jgi:hypothetical protein
MITKSGWQATVLIFSQYVIKELRNYEESRERIAPYLRHRGKSEEEIDEAARQAIDDTRRSLQILKTSSCPRELIGNPVFLDANRFRQDRAMNLVVKIQAQLRNGRVSRATRVLDEYVCFNLELWSHGIYEKTYKLDNFGYVGRRMILVDFLELSDDLQFIREHLRENDWSRVCSRYGLPDVINDYFVTEAGKRLTVENFEEHWRTRAIELENGNP